MQTILVVEDDEMLNTGICYNLDAEKLISVPVFTLQEARNQLKEQEFDLIILDVNLPDGDGFLFFEEIRAKTNHLVKWSLQCCRVSGCQRFN